MKVTLLGKSKVWNSRCFFVQHSLSEKQRRKFDSKMFSYFPVPQHLKTENERRMEMFLLFLLVVKEDIYSNLVGSTTESHPNIQQDLLEWEEVDRAMSSPILIPVYIPIPFHEFLGCFLSIRDLSFQFFRSSPET